MKKNLAILINSMSGGGAERVISILLNDLANYYNVTLVLLDRYCVYEISNKINIEYLQSVESNQSLLKFIKLPFLAINYKKLCKEKNIHISLSFLTRSNIINILSRTLFNSKVKVIVNERGTPSLYYGNNSIQSKINKLLIKKLYPKANLVITNAKGNYLDLTNNFKIRNNIVTIYNPIDLEFIHSKIKGFAQIDNSKFTFITVGRLDEGKNHELMIEALSVLSKKEIQLIILGDGILKNKLQRKVKELKLEKKIFFLGFDSNPYKYLIRSDCFLFTSNYEGFPNVLLEAMACKLPIISTDCISGPREILSSNNNLNKERKIELEKYGILIPLNDVGSLVEAMNLIMDNKHLKNQYISLSSERIIDFSKDKYINKMIDILNEYT